MRFTPLVTLLSTLGSWTTVAWLVATALVLAKIARKARQERDRHEFHARLGHLDHSPPPNFPHAILENSRYVLLMGFFGTFLGVTAALPHMNDLELFIEEMAVAMVTTLICISVVVIAFMCDRPAMAGSLTRDPAGADPAPPRQSRTRTRHGGTDIQVAVELMTVLLLIFMAMAMRAAVAANGESEDTTAAPPPPAGRGMVVGAIVPRHHQQQDSRTQGLPGDPWLRIAASDGEFLNHDGARLHGPDQLEAALRAHAPAATRVYLPAGVACDEASMALIARLADLTTASESIPIRPILLLPENQPGNATTLEGGKMP